MGDYTPITLQVIDDKGNTLVDMAVPFRVGIDVQQVMESAFVLAQTTATRDPFLYTVEYYGYSEDPQYPGYLGYEIESICSLPTNDLCYWALSVSGIISSAGADTTFPGPGSTVLWKYTPIPANPAKLTARARVVQSRRSARVAATKA
jgi:hypothetical protein